MKKITRFSIFVLIIMIVFQNIMVQSCYAIENAVPEIEMSENSASENIKINIKYPQFGGKDKKLEDLNHRIKQEIDTWKSDMMDLNKQYIEQAKKNNFPIREFELFGTYKTTYNNNDFISTFLDKYQYTGGAHGISSKSMYNFDIKKQKYVKLNELFKKNYDFKRAINTKIRTDILKDKDIYFDAGKQFKGIKDNQSYYITKDGIVIHFGLYEIAPYSSGYREFLIPFSLIKDGLIYNF